MCPVERTERRREGKRERRRGKEMEIAHREREDAVGHTTTIFGGGGRW